MITIELIIDVMFKGSVAYPFKNHLRITVRDVSNLPRYMKAKEKNLFLKELGITHKINTNDLKQACLNKILELL